MSHNFESIESALHWMTTLQTPIKRVGLERIKEALSWLGNPQHDFPVIHVTGTNGKGSTTAFMRDMLMAHDLKVGTFTSPHIMAFNERIAINAQPIDDADLLNILNQMYALNAYMATTQHGIISGFELFTVMMCVYFSNVQIDVGIIEVGIGGLNDCTNVMSAAVAVVTSIGLDHVELLGDRVELVAEQKAGIIKQHSDVVVSQIPQETLAVFERISRERHANLVVYGTAFHIEHRIVNAQYHTTFDLTLPPSLVKQMRLPHVMSLTIGLVGEHQVYNASTAVVASLLYLQRVNIAPKIDAIQTSVAQTRWMARMEQLVSSPIVYIDGAHNAQGLQSLSKTCENYFATKKVTVLYAGLKKKNQEKHLAILSALPVDKIYLSGFEFDNAMQVGDFHRIIDAPVFGERVKAHEFEGVHTIDYWELFLAQYLEVHEQDAESVLIVTGSLYFVSQVRQWLIANNAH